MLRQKEFIKAAGDKAVIWVNPRNVKHGIGTKWPVGKGRLRSMQKRMPTFLVNLIRPYVKAQEPFVVPRAYFGTEIPFETDTRYVRVEDFIKKKDAPTRDCGQSS